MTLYVVATPIGTLDDLSPRARAILGRVAVIAAEDTRMTRKLLTAVGVPAPHLVALHAHNESEAAGALVDRALREEIALVSDAGTPGISDPGRELVAMALAAGVEVRSVPGPSALASALAASGFPAAPSTFIGFAPLKGRDGFAEDVLGRAETVVIYEAPTRLADLVERLAALSPDREAAMCREISKKFEEIRRAPLSELSERLAKRELLGECVLVVGPGEPWSRPSIEVAEDASLGDLAAAIGARLGIPKREAYQRLLAWKNE